MDKKKEKNFINVPNFLSILRIILVPFFLVMVLRKQTFEALLIFLLAGATDFLDGLSARLWNQKTKIGALLDPAADKLLMATSYIVLSVSSLNSPNNIPVWLTVIVIFRDLYISTGAFFLFKKTGHKSFNPTIMGKLSTVFQIGSILLVLFFNYLQTSPVFLDWIFYLTFLITLISGIQYTFIGIKLYSPH